MDHLLPNIRAPHLILAVVWLVGTILLTLFGRDLWEAIWLGSWLVKWIFVAAGAGIVFSAMKFCVRHWERRRSSLAAVAVVVIGLIAQFVFGDALGMDARFMLSRGHYERRLKAVLAAPFAEHARDVREVEWGPPTRVAFMWSGGLGDNWIGLIYDLTGEVMQASQFRRDQSNWNDPKLAKVKGLFGGNLIASRHLTGPWYLCWFT